MEEASGRANEPPLRRISVIRRIISRVCSGGDRDGLPTRPLLPLHFRPLGLQGWCLSRDYYMDFADYHRAVGEFFGGTAYKKIRADRSIRGRKHDGDMVRDDG